MTTSFAIVAGNRIRSTITFTPETPDALVDLANVSCRYSTCATESGLGGITGFGDCTGIAQAVDDTDTPIDNKFTVELTIPDDTPDGWWQLRWESNDPSPKIAVEDESTKFQVIASTIPSP